MKRISTLLSLACVSASVSLLACAPDGYYDSNGMYHPNVYNPDHNAEVTNRAYATDHYYGYNDNNAPGYNGYNGSYAAPAPVYSSDYNTVTTQTSTYTRPGYYDRNGYYISNGPQAPQGYFPTQGMCRVWFPDRPYNYQPPVESCNGIQGRVPVGAYVIYGG